MALKYTRVRDINTGHEYDVLSHRVDETRHELADQERWPPSSHPRRPRHNVKGPRPARNTAGGATDPTGETERSDPPATGGAEPKPSKRLTRSRKTNPAG